MRKKPERLKLRTEELEAILERARSAPLSEEDLRTLKAALATLEFLTQELKQKRTSIERLRHLLFGPPSEKTQNVLGQRRPEEEAGAEAKAQSSGQARERKRPGRTGAMGPRRTGGPSGWRSPTNRCAQGIGARRAGARARYTSSPSQGLSCA